jgi:hypothetical protein
VTPQGTRFIIELPVGRLAAASVESPTSARAS